MATRKKTKTKKRKSTGGGIKSFQRAVKGNKSLQAANRALKKATARKKAAYKKAVAAAKRKMKKRC